jgi:hypothetical protein
MFNSRLNLEGFKLVWELLRSQPWLDERTDQLYELLGSCENDEEIHLVSETLKLFSYLTNESFNLYINDLASKVVNTDGLSEDNTVFSAFTFDGCEADSGQQIVQCIKSVLPKLGWGNPKTVNLCTRIPRSINSHPNVFLVDEFIGSGQTILGRINYLEKEIAKRDVDEYKISVSVIACMKQAKELLEARGIEVYAPLVLDRGISDRYEGQDLADATQLMLKLEQGLQPQIRDKTLPSFGYNQVEALYCMETGNCPNSVFPIFWWPKNLSGNDRKTLLTRAGL